MNLSGTSRKLAIWYKWMIEIKFTIWDKLTDLREAVSALSRVLREVGAPAV